MGRRAVRVASLGSEWAMPGLSVFDNGSEDDETYGAAFAIDRVVGRLRREVKKQRNGSS